MSAPSGSHRIDRALRLLMMINAGLLVLVLVAAIVLVATRPPKPTAPIPPAGDTSVVDGSTDSAGTGDSTPSSVDVGNPLPADSVTLPETPDAGVTYQDSLIFVGDSLTAHMIQRGVLTDGRDTHQVWATENQMLNLNSEVTSAKILLPGTGAAMTIAKAAETEKPPILVITLGTDWGVAYLNETDFKACYTKLIRDIQKASPDTAIILQSIFPVTAGCTLLDNGKIDVANTWVKAIATETECRYLDTQSVLKGPDNCLREDFCNSSDGIHLGAEAYVTILAYMRTHALTDSAS